MSSSRNAVLLTGVNFLNQGAYMMLRAAARFVREDLSAIPVVDVRWGGMEDMYTSGVAPHVELPLEFSFSSVLPDRFRRRAPVSTRQDVIGVLDCSGFAFGDQWKDGPLDRRSKRLERYSKQAPVVMMPQAFGPFTETEAVARRAFDASSLIFARDRVSMRHASELVGEDAKLRLAPDFTVELTYERPRHLDAAPPGVPIVPNWNIAKRVQGGEAAYRKSLAEIVRRLRSSGKAVYGLCHEGGSDLRILQAVARDVGDLIIVEGYNGLEMKWLLSQAPAVVSGRFHATVSALSQGVPVIIHGWSHKYGELAHDFGVSDLIADPVNADESVDRIRSSISDEQRRAAILCAAQQVKARSKQMWTDVRNCIERA